MKKSNQKIQNILLYHFDPSPSLKYIISKIKGNKCVKYYHQKASLQKKNQLLKVKQKEVLAYQLNNIFYKSNVFSTKLWQRYNININNLFLKKTIFLMYAQNEEKNNEKQIIDYTSLKLRQGRCSTCKKYNSYSWDFYKNKVYPETYQLLYEKGWIRCGTLYYKKDPELSCCKYWGHRINVNDFKIKKDQKRTIRKVCEMLLGSGKKKEEKEEKEQKAEKAEKEEKKEQGKKQAIKKAKEEVKEEEEAMMKKVALKLNQLIRENPGDFWGLVGEENLADQSAEKLQLQPVAEKLKCFVSKPGEKSSFYCNYGMLLFGINKKLFRKDFSVLDFVKAVRPFIEGHGQKDEDFNLQLERSGYLLFIIDKSNPQANNKFIQAQQKLSELEQKNQTLAEQAEKREDILQQEKKEVDLMQEAKEKKSFDMKNIKLKITSNEITFGNLTIKIVPVEESEESLKIYQQHSFQVHDRSYETMDSYSDFLCTNGMISASEQNSSLSNKRYIPSWENSKKPEDGQPITGTRVKNMGCFHMKYYLEDTLIAVGVVDIFPQGMLSVYFFHAMAYRGVRLGVFSALIEIQYVRWLQLSFPEFRYYSMASYIQNNSKMLYKVDYQPCQLLCPITHQFIQFTPQVKEKINKIIQGQAFDVRIAPEEMKIHEDMDFSDFSETFIEDSTEFLDSTNLNIHFATLKQARQEDIRHNLNYFSRVWGKQLCNIFSFKIPDYYINQPEEENNFDFEYLSNPVAQIISESDSDN